MGTVGDNYVAVFTTLQEYLGGHREAAIRMLEA
jgi:hypothetical protein